MPSKKYEYVRKTFTYEGRRYEVKGKTEEEALEKKAELKAKLKRGEAGISGNMLVKAWVTEYIATYVTPRIRPAGAPKTEKHTLTAKSAGMYTEKLEGYVVPAVGALRLREVTQTHLQRILNEQAGKSFSHCNKLLHTIQALFHQAYRSRLILFDPAEDLVLPSCTEKRRRRTLTAYEEKIFRQVAKTHTHGLWALFHLEFGVRPGEVPPLRVKDLDFKRHLLYVSQALESGSKAIKEPKTEAGVRAIPIPPDLEPQLKAHVAGRSPFDYLFPSAAGGIMSADGIRRRWVSFKRAMNIAMGAKLNRYGGIDPKTSVIADDLTLYCTRHTFCTDVVGVKGIDASRAIFITGHSDVASLANYLHPTDAVVKSIAEQMYPKKKPKKKKKEAAQA